MANKIDPNSLLAPPIRKQSVRIAPPDYKTLQWECLIDKEKLETNQMATLANLRQDAAQHLARALLESGAIQVDSEYDIALSRYRINHSLRVIERTK